MSNLDISPERARADAQAYRDQLGRALHALADARHVVPGATPRDVIYTEDKVSLFRYRAPESWNDAADAVPRYPAGPAILICYALINRPSMMDLQADRSLIRGLLSNGLDVYLIEWGSPDGSDRFLDLNDYINRYLHRCIDQTLRVRGEDKVNLVGVCQGGTLSLCYTALHPERVRNLIAMVTPVDFHTPNDLISKWVRHVDVDTLVDKFGNVSGETLNGVFLSLLPFRLMSQKYVGFMDIAADPAQVENFLRMEQWIFDSPDNPGEMFRQFSNWFYKENRLRNGTLQIRGKPIDLRRVSMPVLNIYAMQDHIVPPASSLCMKDLIGTSDYTEHAVPSGHIGIYVSSKSRELPATIANWLRARPD
ncbi:MAG TPA: class III poly(R)-hydroxyalkanoic acid synthase subunit PhaC [Steroidobacteraceae bacterium]|nr:class III poly(R)-hydroxyalkanoic acid synthase subunit PhaC [Steroidobacteraceae bacterium]